MGFPIRQSPGQRLFAPIRRLTQPTTAFIASRYLGIHHTSLVTWTLDLPPNKFSKNKHPFRIFRYLYYICYGHSCQGSSQQLIILSSFTGMSTPPTPYTPFASSGRGSLTRKLYLIIFVYNVRYGQLCFECYLKVNPRSHTTFKIHLGFGYEINDWKQLEEKTKSRDKVLDAATDS